MARQFSDAQNYSRLFSRVEQKFDVTELTPKTLEEWSMGSDFVISFSLSRQIFIQVQRAKTIDQLNELRDDARQLLVYKQKIMDLIDEKSQEIAVEQREIAIAKGIFQSRVFAKERKIRLSETVLGRVETWNIKGKKVKVLTIRENGAFRGWRKL